MPRLKLLLSFCFLLLSFSWSTSSVSAQATTPPPPNIDFFLEQVLIGVNQAHAAGMKPIIRVGVHGASGFEDPAQLVIFATRLSAAVTQDVYLIAGPNEPESELWTAPPNCRGLAFEPLGACVGPPTAQYMNTIITGAGNLPHILLLSPAFNLCSPVFPHLISAMNSTANWSGLDGIAVNVYNGAPAGSAGTVNACLNERLPLIGSGAADKPVIITETGAFDQNLPALANEIASLPGRVQGALLFNALNTNPGWSQFALSDPEINSLCAGNCSDRRVGVNFATVYTHGDYVHADALNMGWTLEILGEGGGYDQPPSMERLTNPCSSPSLNFHPLRPDPFNPCDPLIPSRDLLTFQCGNGLVAQGTFNFPNLTSDNVRNRPLLNPGDSSAVLATDPYKDSLGTHDDRLYRCQDDAANSTRPNICAIQRVPLDVEIDIANTTLPVIGYTQRTYPPDLRANAYLSWYLQGADWDATPSPADPLIFSGPIRKLLGRDNQDSLRLLVASRVYNDLHNYLVRPSSRNLTITSAATQSLREIFSQIPLSSMEDIVGELTVSIIPESSAQPTFTGPSNGATSNVVPEGNPFNRNGLRLHIARTPSSTSLDAFSDGRLYMPHLRETYGLAYILQNYAMPKNSPAIFSGSHTLNPDTAAAEADKRQLLGAPDKSSHLGLQDNTVIQYTSESPEYGIPTRNTELIDNPIPRLGNQILQSGNDVSGTLRNSLDRSTQLDNATTGRAPAPRLVNVNGRFVTSAEPRYGGYTGVCQLSNTMQIPGDSLVSTTNPWKVRARLTYTGIFKYPSLPPPNCQANACDAGAGGFCTQGVIPGATSTSCGTDYRCQANVDYQAAETICRANCSLPPDGPLPPNTCYWPCFTNNVRSQERNGQCIPESVVRIDTGARVAVYTKTPLVENIYDRLVGGWQSVLRRFLPGRTPELASNNQCNTEYIKGETFRVQDQLDASCVKSVTTNVAYTTHQATTGAGSPDNPSLVDSVNSAPSPANVFFPYLGSLYDYFLGCGSETLNLQKIIRPQGFNSICGTAVVNPPAPNQRRMVALVIGQSNAASFGDTRFSSYPTVRCLTGSTLVPAADPLCGSDGPGGTMWTRLGNLIIDSGRYTEVIFVPAAVGSSAISTWVPGGSNHALIQNAISNAQAQNLTITHVLWLQGETDSWLPLNTSREAYRTALDSVITSIRSRGVTAPFFVSLATRCDPTYPQPDPDIRAAQTDVLNPTTNVVRGIDLDAIKANPLNRGTVLNGTLNACHLSNAGLMSAAQSWLGLIQ